MAFSVSPSVIVREVDASAVIPAIATPPAAIAGVFRWGPTNEPVLVTSEDQLVDRFGRPTNDNYETFFTSADFLSYSNALYVVRVEDDNANTASSTHFNAKYQGDLGNSLEVSYVTPGDFQESIAEVGDLSGSISFNTDNVDIVADSSAAATAFTGAFSEMDVLRIGNDSIGYQELYVETVNEAANNEFEFTFSNKYTLPETDLSALKVERKWRYAYLFGDAPSANAVHIIVKDAQGEITGTQNEIIETYENVSTLPGAKRADGSNNYYPTVLENRSKWIEASNTVIDASIVDTAYEQLSGGSDTASESAISLGAVAAGYDNFVESKELDIAFVLQGKGDPSANRANYIVSNILESRKDAVGFLSPAKEDVVDPVYPNQKLNNAINYRNQIQSSSYWFMDSGYKYRYDKYNDSYRWVPLNGDMAGLTSRIEPWESPAGYKRGIIKNVIKLAFNPNKTQRDLLYGSDINSVISITGQGILLFGDKTGQGTASAFDRINVRRLFITVEKAIATAAESFLFEFNDEFTRAQFRNLVEPLLRDIQGRRGIIDFRVVSDETVNTPDVIDQNRFRANIFIKPARSINIIELTFVATRTGVEFDEIVGQIT